MKSRCQRWKR